MSTQRSTPSPQTVGSALSEAQAIIEAAEKRAADLQGAAERTYLEAKQAGFAEGFAEGQQQAVETAIRMMEDSTAIGEKLSEEAARLALAICQSVVSKHIDVQPELVKEIASRALQQSIVGDTVTILANPEDQALLEAHIDYFRRIASGASVRIESEPTLSRGGCIVKTEFGEVDASIDTLIANVKARFGV